MSTSCPDHEMCSDDQDCPCDERNLRCLKIKTGNSVVKRCEEYTPRSAARSRYKRGQWLKCVACMQTEMYYCILKSLFVRPYFCKVSICKSKRRDEQTLGRHPINTTYLKGIAYFIVNIMKTLFIVLLIQIALADNIQVSWKFQCSYNLAMSFNNLQTKFTVKHIFSRSDFPDADGPVRQMPNVVSSTEIARVPIRIFDVFEPVTLP